MLTSNPTTKPQSEWINLMHGDQLLKTLNCQQQKKQLKLCGTYKQSYNAKPKYALDDQPNTTTGQIKEKMLESKTRKPEESSSNWKTWHRDWDATTSNFQEDDASNDGNKYRYNRKGFLEEYDARSDDSIFIMDLGWDDYCLQAIKLNHKNFWDYKKFSSLEWENPFAAKRGKDHTVLHILEEKEDLPYPKFQKFEQLAAQIVKRHEEHAFPTAADDAESSTSYQPLPDAIIDQTTNLVILKEKAILFVKDMESITINRLNSQTWSDNKAKLAFVENLLGESEKLMWQQWGIAYLGAYFALETITDETQNITSQVRQLIIMEDPYRGSTDEQDRAYKDLDRITCEETKNLWSFLTDFRQLAIKSGKLAGVLPAIKFTHTFVSEMCKDAALAKELRDLCFICGKEGHFAKDCRSKQGNIARSAVYQELDIDDNWDIVLADFDDSSVYSLSEGECDVQQNISIMVQDTPIKEAAFMAIEESDDEQDIEEEYDSHHAFMFHPGPPTKIADMVQSAGSWKPDKDLPTQSKSYEHDWKENTVTNYTICYYCGILTTDMSRLNCPKCQLTSCALYAKNYLGKTVNVKRKQQHKPEKEKDFSSNEVRLLKELLKEKTEQVQQMIIDLAKEYYESKIAIKEKEELWQTERSLLVRDLTDALKIIDQLKAEQIKLEEEKGEEIRRLKAQLQEKKDKEIKVQFSKEEFPPLGNSQIARPFMEAEAHYSENTTTAPKIRKITNQLYNVKVEFEIPNCPMFGTTAIIDTGASACYINKKVILEEALEPLTQTVFFNGLNSRQQATHRIKQGYFLIKGNKFKIPLIYAFDMRDSNGIEMLIGANFLRSMRGGIRTEGDEITIYKKVTRIKTSNQIEIVEIAELEVSEEEFLEINESIYFNQEGSK
nr:RNA-directed DNA polymerase [Tanacetum cinerariifolium]